MGSPDSLTGRVAVIGCRGTLGAAFARMLAAAGADVVPVHRGALDLANPDLIDAAIDVADARLVINAAGFVRVDDAEGQAAACRAVNAHAPIAMAAACSRHGCRLITFSSDLVFDGAASSPYTEHGTVNPLSEYGRSKAEAEAGVLDAMPQALVIRTSSFFGPWDEANVPHAVRSALMAGLRVSAVSDVVMSPTYVPHLVTASLRLAADGHEGIRHVANEGAVSWAGLARKVAAVSGLDPALVDDVPATAAGWVAERPRYSALASQYAPPLPDLDSALGEWASQPIAGVTA